MTRFDRHAIVHDLRAKGCDCVPQIIALDPIQGPPGAFARVTIDHRYSCPLDAWSIEDDRARTVPTLIATRPRCRR